MRFDNFTCQRVGNRWTITEQTIGQRSVNQVDHIDAQITNLLALPLSGLTRLIGGTPVPANTLLICSIELSVTSRNSLFSGLKKVSLR